MAVFDIPQGTFKVRTEQESSPFGGVLADAITKRLARAEAAKAEAEVPYAGLSAFANALAKSAYSQAVGPQVLAKAAENPKLWANFNEGQRESIPSIVYKAGINGTPSATTGTNPLNEKLLEIWKSEEAKKSQHPVNMLAQGLKKLFGGGEESPLAQQQNIAPQVSQQQIIPQQMNQLVNSPAQQNISPETGQQVLPVNANSQNQPTSVRNELNYEASIAQEKARGSERGKEYQNRVTDLGDSYKLGLNNQLAIDEMKRIVTSPVYEQMRQIPAFKQHEIGWYKTFGTKDQKELIGNLLATQGQMIQNFVASFKGSAQKSEVNLAMKSKVNEGDPIEVAKGKIESLTAMNQLTTQRSYLTGKLMEDKNMSYIDASKAADKMLNGDEVRQKIHDELFSKGEKKSVENNDVTAENLQYTAQQLGISVPEVIERLEKKGIKVARELP